MYPEEDLRTMLNEASGPLNFSRFLATFGERLISCDGIDTIRCAFKAFDESDGKVKLSHFKKTLTTFGEKLTDEEFDGALRDAPIDSRGRLDLKSYVETLTGWAEDSDSDDEDE